MKCPKCGYLGYERVERCRNCGYEFSLTAPPSEPDLRLRERPNLPGPLDDLDLIEPDAQLDADRFVSPPGRAPSEQLAGLAELPLFGAPVPDDVPLITRASAPRTPLSVRRATPELPRLRSEPRAPLLEWSEPTPPPTPSASARPTPGPARSTVMRQAVPEVVAIEPTGTESEDAAPIGARALAAIFDVVLLSVVDVIVVYFTLQICGLTLSEAVLLPKGPLLAFLLLQNGGYFIAFTATGQTLGKMIAGVRVLSDDTDSAPDVGRSTVRTILWMLLALPAGLGLLTATLSRDGRGLHDRFAGTRVVRTGA